MAKVVDEFDALRIKELTEDNTFERVLVVDADGNIYFKNQTDIEPDLDRYLTESETLDLLSNYLTETEIENLLNGYYTEMEINDLLSNQTLDKVLTLGNSAGNKTIEDLADPVNEQDVANKRYVDNQTTKSLKETVVTDGGSIASQPTPTTFIKFTSQTTPVILAGFGDASDGKKVTVWNQTLQAMDILNESPSATANERISVLGEQDVFLPIDGKSVFRYSVESSCWTMVGIFGAGYESTLIGSGERAVTVNAEGVYQEEELMEAKAWNPNITTNQSNSDLNTAYPDVLQGFVLVCPENGREYELYDESQTPKKWLWRTITKVV